MSTPERNVSQQPHKEGSLATRNVIVMAGKIASRLAETYPEIAELYKSGLTRREIAQQFIPDITTSFPPVALTAIGFVLAELMPPEERMAIAKKKSSDRLKKRLGSLSDEERKERQQNAGRKRAELPYDVEAAIRARGRTPWTGEEKSLASFLAQQDAYLHEKGAGKGHPNYALIASALNERFHNGIDVRNKNSVAATMADLRNPNRTSKSRRSR